MPDTTPLLTEEEIEAALRNDSGVPCWVAGGPSYTTAARQVEAALLKKLAAHYRVEQDDLGEFDAAPPDAWQCVVDACEEWAKEATDA